MCKSLCPVRACCCEALAQDSELATNSQLASSDTATMLGIAADNSGIILTTNADNLPVCVMLASQQYVSNLRCAGEMRRSCPGSHSETLPCDLLSGMRVMLPWVAGMSFWLFFNTYIFYSCFCWFQNFNKQNSPCWIIFAGI